MSNLDHIQGWQVQHDAAVAYERNLVPVLMDPWARDLVATVEPGPDARVLDLACGTGVVARHTLGRLGPDAEIVGVDVNTAMLSVARETTARPELPVAFKEASADDLPFADSSFDVVLCQQGLQFFADRRGALEEARRVTRPGGRLGLSTCRSIEHAPGYVAVADCLTRHVGVEAGEVIRSPYGLGDDGELRSLVRDAGFGDVHLRVAVWQARFPSAEGLLQAETSSSPLGALVGRLDADVHAALVDDLTQRLRPHTDDDGVVFAFETMIVTAMR